MNVETCMTLNNWFYLISLILKGGINAHLEKETATPSGILAWRIPWTEEPDRL